MSMEFIGKRFKSSFISPAWGVDEDCLVVNDKKYEFASLPQIPTIVHAPNSPLTNGTSWWYLPDKKGPQTFGFKYADKALAMAALAYAVQKIEEANGANEGTLFRFMDKNGSKLYIFEDYLTIEHNASRIIATTAGGMGAKRVNYRDLTSITFRRPQGITVGYIQISYAGSVETGSRAMTDIVNDENTVLIDVKDVELAEKIVAYVEDRRSQIADNATVTNVTQNSDADELRKFKELLDDGIISQEEFDAKKRQILGL